LISEPILILTPSRNGIVVILYKSGRRALVDVVELHADGEIAEINQAISQHSADWDYTNWQDPDKWHNGALTQARSIQKVVIERAEGLTGHPTMKKVTFAGDTAEEQGNQWLRLIAETAPKEGGYDKTDVWVTLSNGQEFKYRFDVQHTSLPDNDTDIRQHVRTGLIYNCRPEEIPHIAAKPEWLEHARRSMTPENKAAAEWLVALLDADPLDFPCAIGADYTNITFTGNREEAQ
jgi:hypothetical protein